MAATQKQLPASSERLIRLLTAKLSARLVALDDLPDHGRITWRRRNGEIELALEVTL